MLASRGQLLLIGFAQLQGSTRHPAREGASPATHCSIQLSESEAANPTYVLKFKLPQPWKDSGLEPGPAP
jgi:nucleoid DNA-binding protein